jgi:hypothetical protein
LLHNLIKIIINFSLYFANSGLHTQLNLLNTGRAWWTLLVLIVLASIAKIVPVTLVSKLCSKKPWFYCLSIGVLMNTRGIVQLVVLNIGVELGVISPKIFAIFVLMAVILTLFTSPILSLLYRRNYDIRKLSLANIAADLRDVREGEINTTEEEQDSGNNDHISTISNGAFNYNQSKRTSIKSLRKSITNIPAHTTTVTFDDQANYATIDPNGIELETSAVESTGTMMISGPRRSICMTRF